MRLVSKGEYVIVPKGTKFRGAGKLGLNMSPVFYVFYQKILKQGSAFLTEPKFLDFRKTPKFLKNGYPFLPKSPWKMGRGPGGVLKFGFGREVPPRNLKVDPYKYQFFKKKRPIHIPIGPIFGQILIKITRFFQNFLKFEPILTEIWGTFEKSTHSYTKFCIL